MDAVDDAEPNNGHKNPIVLLPLPSPCWPAMRNAIEYPLSMSRIPQELVDLIIDLIASASLDDDDWRLHRTDTLRASVEDPEADFKLFWLSPEPPNYIAFLSIFRKSPRKPWVKELVVRDLTVKTRGPFVEAMTCIARVESITFGGGSPSDPPVEDHLGVGSCGWYPYLDRTISIPSLCSMPMLESLTILWPITIENPTSSPTDWTGNKTVVNTSLHLLDVSSCPPPFDRLLLNLFALTTVKALLISPTLDPGDVPVDFRALRVLEIDHTHRHVLDLPPSIRLALPFYNAPKVVLRLTCGADLNGYIQALEDVVARTRAGLRVDLLVMRELHVHVFSDDWESEQHVWERLDSVLGDMVGLGFDRLVVSSPSGGEAIKKAMKLLGKMLLLNGVSQM
ncbi:hypothetical protein BDZ89DRAFT_1072491 [Hymenopellis radicata]|nr:hypothetical protein BDZ89DRAFT_1072491 [Hymenopellis radicata]